MKTKIMYIIYWDKNHVAVSAKSNSGVTERQDNLAAGRGKLQVRLRETKRRAHHDPMVIAPSPRAKLYTKLCNICQPYCRGNVIVDQLYDYVPTLKSIPACFNSLRVVSPGVQRRKSTRKDPVTRTESLVRTRPPPRTAADSVSIQWSCVVKS